MKMQEYGEKLFETIGYRFSDENILYSVFTHRSRANENPEEGIRENELMEFLGDALLGFVISGILYRKFPSKQEGDLTRIRADLVCSAQLAKKAKSLRLGKYIRLGRGEEKTGGREKPSILANVYEALIGGIYLDGGMRAAARFIKNQFRKDLDSFARLKEIPGEPKSRLQELLHTLGKGDPRYSVTDVEGPEHQKTYLVSLSIDGLEVAAGRGGSKKEAEQKAAKLALKELPAKRRKRPPVESPAKTARDPRAKTAR
jgi:ribonuclease-3